jgi:hypothetical protein
MGQYLEEGGVMSSYGKAFPNRRDLRRRRRQDSWVRGTDLKSEGKRNTCDNFF